MSGPASWSAVESDRRTHLFYVKAADNTIGYLVQNAPRGQYTANDLHINGQPVTAAATSIAAVAYEDSRPVKQIRVYYIGFVGGQNVLREICWSGDRDGWYYGAVDGRQEIHVLSRDSQLSAVLARGEDLKVYYMNPHGELHEAAVAINEEAWYAARLVYDGRY